MKNEFCHTRPTRGNRHQDGTPFDELLPGDWMFDADGDRDTVTFRCPCGECVIALPIYHKEPKPGPNHWEWNGVEDSLTLSPSIRRLDRCKWHGHVVGGVWTPCGDSGK
jgi:hypothetical protein